MKEPTGNMARVNREELEKVSYLEIPPGDPRAVPLFPCHRENGEWELWVPVSDGELMQIKVVEPVESLYFAASPAAEEDGYLDFFDVVLRHGYFEDIATFSQHLLDDIFNLSASVAKLDLLFECWCDDRSRVGYRFVVTELEYLFGTCRSMFDLLHKVIVRYLSRCAYLDAEAAPIQQLPQNSFRSVALHGQDDKPRDVEEMRSKWNLPVPFAQFYRQHADFFRWMRDYRVAIAHHGKGPKPVFLTERGFAISTSEYPFDALEIWTEENLIQPNSLGSLRSVVGHLITKTLETLEHVAAVLRGTELLPDVARGVKIWIRGPHVKELKALKTHVSEEPWYREAESR